jgi:hypothetical protein
MNADDKGTSGQESGDESTRDAARLDGNAAAGILSELFVPDLTTARATCANCGAIRPLGALLVYAHGMGTILRCPGCDALILRVAHTRTHLWFELTGARLVVIAAGAAIDDPRSSPLDTNEQQK